MRDRKQIKLGVYTSDGFFSGQTKEQVEAGYKKEKIKPPIFFASAPASKRYFERLKSRSHVTA